MGDSHKRILACAAVFGAAVACNSPARYTTAVPDSAQHQRWTRAGDTAGPSQRSGADGTSSVPLPDGRTAWVFSDTYLGPVNADGSRENGVGFVRNSLVVQDGDRLTTVAGDPPVPVSYTLLT